MSRTKLVSHKERAAAMRAQPGVWIPVNVYPMGVTARQVAHRIADTDEHEGRWYVPSSAFETAVTMVEDGWQVSGRYKGEKDGEGRTD